MFVVGTDNKVTFRPVKVGIAGEKYFEVLSGLKAGEKIVAGTYQAIRELEGRRARAGSQEATTRSRQGRQIVSDSLTSDLSITTTGEHPLSTTAERKAVVHRAGAAPDKDWVIVTRGIKREYDMGGEIVRALRGVDLAIRRNEYVAIMGPSGSGKSTLMNLIGCLDTPNAGEYWLNGKLVSKMTDDELARVRNKEIGFVFQTFNLLPRATALHNVELPLVYAGVSGRTSARRARQEALGPRAARRSHGPPAERALRRSAPARRDRARAREQPVDPPRRRADR